MHRALGTGRLLLPVGALLQTFARVVKKDLAFRTYRARRRPPRVLCPAPDTHHRLHGAKFTAQTRIQDRRFVRQRNGLLIHGDMLPRCPVAAFEPNQAFLISLFRPDPGLQLAGKYGTILRCSAPYRLLRSWRTTPSSCSPFHASDRVSPALRTGYPTQQCHPICDPPAFDRPLEKPETSAPEPLRIAFVSACRPLLFLSTARGFTR